MTRHKKPKKKLFERKPDRKKLIKELDRVFSIYIRKRDGQCVQCLSKQNLTCGHLFSRVAHSTRWDENNCFGQCRNCNYSHEFDPSKFILWYIRKFGLEKYELLSHKFHSTAKFKYWELEQMIEKYRKLIE